MSLVQLWAHNLVGLALLQRHTSAGDLVQVDTLVLQAFFDRRQGEDLSTWLTRAGAERCLSRISVKTAPNRHRTDTFADSIAHTIRDCVCPTP